RETLPLLQLGEQEDVASRHRAVTDRDARAGPHRLHRSAAFGITRLYVRCKMARAYIQRVGCVCATRAVWYLARLASGHRAHGNDRAARAEPRGRAPRVEAA